MIRSYITSYAVLNRREEHVFADICSYILHSSSCISQIHPGAIQNVSVGYASAFHYRPCPDCGNMSLINSLYYKEHLRTDQDSISVLQHVSKIVSSSTDFKQLAGCANARFSAKWAYEMTWVEAADEYASNGSNMVSVALKNRLYYYACDDNDSKVTFDPLQ